MASDNVFGSDELTPELVRGATFTEEGGRYDAAEVRAFLDRIASSLDVFLSQDAPSALRAEFARNAEIAQQVLDAGQNAAEQLRRQAGEDAHRILEETREATDRLRSEVEGEISRSREQVEGMRAQFIQDLRDLYDRIGASLYRFERAAEESSVAPITEPAAAPVAEQVPAAPAEPAQIAPPVPEPHPVAAAEPEPEAAAPASEPAAPPVAAEPVAEPELPEGAKPPAWQQLPAEAWGTTTAPDAAEPQAAAGEDPFAVQEDEPLAPGEPLVDLRELQVEQAPTPAPAGEGESWLTAADPAGEVPGGADVVPAAEPVVEVSAPTPPAGDDGGGWLLDEPADVAGESDPTVARDDALAEALISGSPFGEEEGGAAGATPPPPPVEAGTIAPDAAASADAVAVRQLILDSLASGQTREAIEAYLRDQMGFMEPGALVDAALGSAGQS